MPGRRGVFPRPRGDAERGRAVSRSAKPGERHRHGDSLLRGAIPVVRAQTRPHPTPTAKTAAHQCPEKPILHGGERKNCTHHPAEHLPSKAFQKQRYCPELENTDHPEPLAKCFFHIRSRRG